MFLSDGQLVCGDEQDETVSALLEICMVLARFGFYGDVLWFPPHVKPHGWSADLHGKVDFSYTEREKDKHIFVLLLCSIKPLINSFQLLHFMNCRCFQAK